jgi:fructokinase
MKSRIIAFGEILWDLLPSASVLGGAAFNFAYRADSLGNDVTIVSRLGKDRLGETALEDIKELGMKTDFIQIDHDHPTGTVNVFFDEQKNPQYTIHEHVAYDYIEYPEPLRARIENCDCLYFGTLAQRERTSRATLEKMVDDFSGRFILYDINLRKHCFTKEVIARSLSGANILKLNEEELSLLNDMFALGKTSIPTQAGRLISVFDMEYVLVTLGDKGSFGVGKEGGELYNRGYKVELVDPVGSGDACTAGFIDRLLAGSSFSEASAYGNALGALVASQEGATRPISREDVDEFMKTASFSEPHPSFEDR